jgi:hypothetical protein
MEEEQDLQYRRGIQGGGGPKIQAQAMVLPILASHQENKNWGVSVSEEIHGSGH